MIMKSRRQELLRLTVSEILGNAAFGHMAQQYMVMGDRQWSKALLPSVDRKQRKMKGCSPTASQQSQRLMTKPSAHWSLEGGDLARLLLPGD